MSKGEVSLRRQIVQLMTLSDEFQHRYFVYLCFPAGAEDHVVLSALSARLKSCPVTKPVRLGMAESFSAASKAPIDSDGFAPGINPRTTSGLSFSAACEAHVVPLALSARLKSCPDTVLCKKQHVQRFPGYLLSPHLDGVIG
jgi:hypothetical protein